ncbi:MAG: CheR family methyltransferase [Chloroflexota bacterium]
MTELATPVAQNAARSVRDVPVLGYGDYLRFSKLLIDRAGLFFSESRRPELEMGIRQAFAASTCATLDEYFNLLCDQQSGMVELDQLINAVTISETHFFRDQAQFNALYERVLPQLIERKRALRSLRIWSAGCASGEEPYSLAILLRELLPDIDQWAITIIGTDINTASLERARVASYGSWAFREDRAKYLRLRYFTPNGNRYDLIPEVRHMVTFKRLNLVEPRYPSYETNTMMMDLILCRNVTIYFAAAVTRWVVDRFYDALSDGGWLVVGHSEPSIEIYRRFRARNFPDTVLYQKSPQTAGLHMPGSKPQPSIAIPPPPAVTAKATGPFNAPSPATEAQIIPAAAPMKETDPLDLARELLDYGRSEDACQILHKLVAERPGDAGVCSLLGKAYANLGNWAEAERYCQQAIEKDRLCLEAYYTLALICQHGNRTLQALEMMKKVVYLDRTYVLGHYGLANLYYENGQLPQAQKSLDNALRLLQGKPDDQMVPGSSDVTVGRLREAITRQQQAWIS